MERYDQIPGVRQDVSVGKKSCMRSRGGCHQCLHPVFSEPVAVNVPHTLVYFQLHLGLVVGLIVDLDTVVGNAHRAAESAAASVTGQ